MANTENKKEIEKFIKSQEDEGQNLYFQKKKIVSTNNQIQTCNLPLHI